MIPPAFFKGVKDFITDLMGTFPELSENTDLFNIFSKDQTEAQDSYQRVFDSTIVSFPSHMVNILKEDDSMFETECVLFGIDFKTLWNENITEKTKNIIWKYLKTILFIVMPDLTISDEFENALKNIDLHKTIDEIKNLFETDGKDIPDLHSPLDGFMNGKLGALAKEIAHETVGDSEESFQDMIKDPSKLFGLMHTVGDKIEKKIKSGDVKESELIAEAAEMLEKMKDMPGMKQFETMFKQFGKMDTGAMQNKMGQNMKKAKNRERLQKKLAARIVSTPTV
jgi:hypothetical protein